MFFNRISRYWISYYNVTGYHGVGYRATGYHVIGYHVTGYHFLIWFVKLLHYDYFNILKQYGIPGSIRTTFQYHDCCWQ